MAKRSSILSRSKTVENRVQRYLWPGTDRAWKELWDIGAKVDGNWHIIGEVKSRKVGGFRDIWTKLTEALEQVESVVPHDIPFVICFAVLSPPNTGIGDAFVMWRHFSGSDTPIITRLSEFKEFGFVKEYDDAPPAMDAQKR